MIFEYIVVVLAAMLAGIGTGLVGLSAATAMVPLLIVLCPTFSGEHGAYMATAIALATPPAPSITTFLPSRATLPSVRVMIKPLPSVLSP